MNNNTYFIAVAVTDEINGKGVKAVTSSTTINGKEYACVVLGNGQVRPSFKITEDMLKTPVPDIAANIIKMYGDEVKSKSDSVNATEISSKSYILKNAHLCLKKHSVADDVDMVKRPFLAYDQYVRVTVPDVNGSYIVTKSLLKEIGMFASELFEAAEKNSTADANVMSMADLLRGKGFPIEADLPCYVVTNEARAYGAGMLTREVAEDLAEKLDDDLVILPSSIHELLVCPREILLGSGRVDEMNDIIEQVNKTVAPEEILGEKLFMYIRGVNQFVQV